MISLFLVLLDCLLGLFQMGREYFPKLLRENGLLFLLAHSFVVSFIRANLCELTLILMQVILIKSIDFFFIILYSILEVLLIKHTLVGSQIISQRVKIIHNIFLVSESSIVFISLVANLISLFYDVPHKVGVLSHILVVLVKLLLK